ncbi:MAG: reverse transcriptase family protein [Bryobacteraceae bacterium]|nr:reverse transcriptase family protein [Bryobacteraceae bacterium]
MPEAWGLPKIASAEALAEWLGLDPPDLAWFADLRGMTRQAPTEALRHYRYHVIVKRHGNLRLIEAPKPRLKAIQRQILTEMLDRVPPHEAAHGFVHGRSIASFAAPHTGQSAVLRLDLDHFFPRLQRARVRAFFETLGYRKPVATLLGGLCTNRAPRFLPWPDFATMQVHTAPHLPQGAPSSPSIANSCAYRADCRLAGLAAAAGVRYTRYADDLAFSGGDEFSRGALTFATHVAFILGEEGFAVNHRKTRLMRQGVQQYLTGLVVNQHLNVDREDFDRLKATLTNCVRRGLASENREGLTDFRAHLEGRVGFVEWINPRRGERLRGLILQIKD